jgi:hypothetical protein
MAGNELRHFAPTDVKITKEQAGRVLKFYFPDRPIDPGALSGDDIAFAQALLLQGIDASMEMGFAQIIFDKAYMKPPTDFSIIKDIAKAFAKQAVKNWFRHATGKDLADPQIYEAVRRTLARNFRSTWAIRMETGELTY